MSTRYTNVAEKPCSTTQKEGRALDNFIKLCAWVTLLACAGFWVLVALVIWGTE